MKTAFDRHRAMFTIGVGIFLAVVFLFRSAPCAAFSQEPDIDIPVSAEFQEELEASAPEINRLKIELKTDVANVDPDKYIVDSGDVLALRIWKPGLNSSVVDVPVLSGKIFLEMVGDVPVGGLSLRETIDKITGIYAKTFPQFKVNVTLKTIRLFAILVSGQTKTPGFVTITPLTRLSTAIDLAEGINDIGSEREIQVKGPDGAIKKYDLIKFKENGDIGQNPKLNNGDSVHVPVRYGTVEVRGDVTKPGVFEIVEGENLQSLKYFFKGLKPYAHKQNIALHRPTSSAALGEGRYSMEKFSWEEFNGEFGKNLALRDGDILEVTSMVERESVLIQGEVQAPGPYTYVNGMRITDALNLAGGYKLDLKDGVSGKTKIIVTHAKGETGQNEDALVVDFEELIIRGNGALNHEIRPGDVVTVMTRADVVYVHGMVVGGGVFPYDPGRNINEYILLAGGVGQEGNKGGVKLFRNNVLFHPKLEDHVKPGDTIYVPASKYSRARKNTRLISEIMSYYFLITRIENLVSGD